MLLCPFMQVEPETVPRPWLLPFMQQGAATVLSWDRKEGFLVRLPMEDRVLFPTCWVEIAK